MDGYTFKLREQPVFACFRNIEKTRFKELLTYMLMENDFYDIPNLNGYKINKKGDIYSTKTNKILKQSICNGYMFISKNNQKLTVHRLVALTFLPKIEGKDIVNHINCDKLDNRLENLEWVTQKENTAAHGKQIHHPKRVMQLDMNDNIIATFNSLKEAGKAIGKTPSAISKAVLQINESAGGFKWKYADEDNVIQVDLTTGKEIKNYPKYYVFPTGHIYNIIRKTYVKPIENASGYCYVTLCCNGKKKNMYVQRLVAEHFIENNDSKKIQVNHKNKIRDNNRVENLEWVTQSENMKHAKATKKSQVCDTKSAVKPVDGLC